MSDSEAPKNKGGRPRKFDAGVRNPTLAFRARGDLYERIKASADERGVSLSHEIERRLDLSFDRGGIFGSPETYSLMLGMAQRLQSYERRFGKPWIEIEDVRFHMAAARAFQEQIMLCQADTELRPLTPEELARTNEPVPELSPEERAASEEAMARGEFGHHPDQDLPSDPEERAPGAPIMVPLPVQPAPAKRTRKKP